MVTEARKWDTVSSISSNIRWFSSICTGCYYWQCQHRRVWRSLDSQLIGYTRLCRCEFRDWLLQHCSCWCTKDSNGQVTACVVTGTWKFDHGLGQILHNELHWLDVPDRVFLKLAVTVHRCLNGRAPPYLSDYCVPAADADTWWHLHYANRQLLPQYPATGSTLTAVCSILVHSALVSRSWQ